MDWLSAKSLPIIGLDISTTAVKLVELSDAGKGMLRVERYAIEPLPKDAVTDGNIANLDQVAEARAKMPVLQNLRPELYSPKDEITDKLW